MKFKEAPLAGAFTIDLDPRSDERGFFARLYCQKTFGDQGLFIRVAQINNSFAAKRGTLRGLHYQLAPCSECKMVRCVRGALWDVMLDLRPDSTTFGQWYGEELTAENRKMLYVPKGFAHGFVTLADDTEMMYFVDEFYAPHAERIVRWNDPRFTVSWPIEPVVISEKDAGAPDFDRSHHLSS